MRIQFLGTAAAEGIPALFCNCETCRTARQRGGKDLRRRTAYLVDDDTMVDFGPDIFWQSMAYGIELEKIQRLLISHSHPDHLAVKELQWRAMGYCNVDTDMTLYGDQAVMDTLHAEMEYFTPQRYHLRLQLAFPGDTFTDGDMTITAIRASHACPPEIPLNYVIQRGGVTALIGHDSGWWREESWEILRRFKLDIVVMEGTCGFGQPDYQSYHMGANAVVRLHDELRKQGILKEDATAVVSHFSHNGHALHDHLEEFFAPHGIQVAYDGMVVER